MRPLKAPAIISLVAVLGCSACTAGETSSKVMSMQNASDQQVLVAGIEVADHSIASSDITFHVLNPGDAAVDMLIWNTPLEQELSADIFTVTLNGVPMDYLGRMVKRSTPGERDYLEIPAHERVETLVDLAVYYEMSEPGEYEVSFTPSIVDGQSRLNQLTPVQLDTTTLTIRVDKN